MFRFLIIFALLFFHLRNTDSCTCVKPAGNVYHHGICNHAIAIHVNVTEEAVSDNPLDASYSFDFISIIKNSTGGPLPNVLSTPSQDPACGVKFQIGTQYLIFGEKGGPPGAVLTGLCHFNQMWERIPVEEIEKFDDYVNNCTSSA